jgi:uncharacterized protein involved in outer membrane biogenesis
MRTFLKILAGVAVLLLVGIVGGIAYLTTMDFNAYKPLIAEEARKATGRDLAIRGDLKLVVSFSPAIAVEGVTFANAPWSSRPEMARVGRFEAQVELMPLLSKQVKVTRLVLAEVDVLLETDAKGRGNWEFDVTPGKKAAETKPAGKAASDAPLPVVSEVHFRNVRLAYRDGRNGRTTALAVDALEATAGGAEDPLKLRLKGSYDGAVYEATGQFGSVAQLLSGAKPFPVALEAQTLAMRVQLEGAIVKPLEGKGIGLTVTVQGDNLAATMKAAAATVPALKEAGPFASVPFSMTGKVADGDGIYTVEPIALKLGGSDLSGKATANLVGKRPSVVIGLNSNLFDLKDVLPQAEKGKDRPASAKSAPVGFGQSAASGSGKRLFGPEPLPLDGLRATDVKISLAAKKIVVDGLPLENVTVEAVLANGRLSVRPASLSVAGGTMTAALALDASAGPTALLDLSVNIKDVDAGTLLRQLDATKDMTGGRLEAKVDLKGRGTSIRDLMGGLNGEAVITLGEGRIKNTLLDRAGGDLAMQVYGALNPLAKKDEFTVLNCGVARFVVKDGMATADKGIAAETTKVNVVGAGAVNLKTGEIDFSVKPEARQGLGINLGGIAGLVRVRGTLAEPQVGVDELEAAKTALSAGTAIATGGLSLLAQGLLGRATADEAPCQTALGRRPVPAKAAAPAVSQPSAPVQPKKEEGSVGGFLKGLGKALDETLGGKGK